MRNTVIALALVLGLSGCSLVSGGAGLTKDGVLAGDFAVKSPSNTEKVLASGSGSLDLFLGLNDLYGLVKDKLMGGEDAKSE